MERNCGLIRNALPFKVEQQEKRDVAIQEYQSLVKEQQDAIIRPQRRQAAQVMT
jgi:hypothetical protein